MLLSQPLLRKHGLPAAVPYSFVAQFLQHTGNLQKEDILHGSRKIMRIYRDDRRESNGENNKNSD